MTKCPAWGLSGTVEARASKCAHAELWERVEDSPKKSLGLGISGGMQGGLGRAGLDLLKSPCLSFRKVKPAEAETAGSIMSFFLCLGLALGAVLSFLLKALV